MSLELIRCPHCNLMMSKLKINKIPAVYLPAGTNTPIMISSVVYSCSVPACGKVISIQADPIQQKNDIANAVAMKLRSGY